LEAVVSLVMTCNQAIEVERVSAIAAGHDALLPWIHDWLAALQRRRGVRGGHDDAEN
jgi:hypothetical protein